LAQQSHSLPTEHSPNQTNHELPSLNSPTINSLTLNALDYRVATLTGGLFDTPFATRFKVVDSLPIDIKKVSKRLRELDVGRVTIIKRGVEVEADELNRKWKNAGSLHKTVFLTPVLGKPRAIICDKSDS
jgi:hypothetical protein